MRLKFKSKFSSERQKKDTGRAVEDSSPVTTETLIRAVQDTLWKLICSQGLTVFDNNKINSALHHCHMKFKFLLLILIVYFWLFIWVSFIFRRKISHQDLQKSDPILYSQWKNKKRHFKLFSQGIRRIEGKAKSSRDPEWDVFRENEEL